MALRVVCIVLCGLMCVVAEELQALQPNTPTVTNGVVPFNQDVPSDVTSILKSSANDQFGLPAIQFNDISTMTQSDADVEEVKRTAMNEAAAAEDTNKKNQSGPAVKKKTWESTVDAAYVQEQKQKNNEDLQEVRKKRADYDKQKALTEREKKKKPSQNILSSNYNKVKQTGKGLDEEIEDKAEEIIKKQMARDRRDDRRQIEDINAISTQEQKNKLLHWEKNYEKKTTFTEDLQKKQEKSTQWAETNVEVEGARDQRQEELRDVRARELITDVRKHEESEKENLRGKESELKRTNSMNEVKDTEQGYKESMKDRETFDEMETKQRQEQDQKSVITNQKQEQWDKQLEEQENKHTDATTIKQRKFEEEIKFQSRMDENAFKTVQKNRIALEEKAADQRAEDRKSMGSSAYNTGASCLEIKQNNIHATDGWFFIKPPTSDQFFEGWCDMKTDGGGWLLVSVQKKNGNTFATTTPKTTRVELKLDTNQFYSSDIMKAIASSTQAGYEVMAEEASGEDKAAGLVMVYRLPKTAPLIFEQRPGGTGEPNVFQKPADNGQGTQDQKYSDVNWRVPQDFFRPVMDTARVNTNEWGITIANPNGWRDVKAADRCLVKSNFQNVNTGATNGYYTLNQFCPDAQCTGTTRCKHTKKNYGIVHWIRPLAIA